MNWLVVPLILAASFATGQKHLGKTCDEILKMGHDKWFDLYIDQKGGSTAAMVDASTIYGDCLFKQNKAALAKLPVADANWTGSQHRQVRKIAVTLFSLEARGGGTMFSVIAASAYVRSEELMQKLIKLGRTKALPTMAQQRKVADLIKGSRKHFDNLARLLKSEKAVDNPLKLTRKDFLRWAYEARTDYEKWVNALPPTRAAANILMLEHLYDSLLPKNFKGG